MAPGRIQASPWIFAPPPRLRRRGGGLSPPGGSGLFSDKKDRRIRTCCEFADPFSLDMALIRAGDRKGRPYEEAAPTVGMESPGGFLPQRGRMSAQLTGERERRRLPLFPQPVVILHSPSSPASRELPPLGEAQRAVDASPSLRRALPGTIVSP